MNDSIDEVVVRIRVLPREGLALLTPEDTIVRGRDVEDVDEEGVLLGVVAALCKLGHVRRAGGLEVVERDEGGGAAVTDGALGKEFAKVEVVDTLGASAAATLLGEALDLELGATASTFIFRVGRGRDTFEMLRAETVIQEHWSIVTILLLLLKRIIIIILRIRRRSTISTITSFL